MIWLLLLSLAAHAQCVDSPPVGDGWGWNGSSSCRVGENSNAGNTDYYGFRVRWTKYNTATQYEIQLQRNTYGWQWIHNAYANQTNQADFEFSSTSVQPGEYLCVRYRVLRNGIWSDYSEQACVSVPEVHISVVPSNTSLAAPTIELY